MKKINNGGETTMFVGMTDDKILNEVAYAIAYKEFVSTKSVPASDLHHGQPREWIETTYESYLLDGTKVKIKHVNHHRYNLQTPFDNHYSYFEIIN